MVRTGGSHVIENLKLLSYLKKALGDALARLGDPDAPTAHAEACELLAYLYGPRNLYCMQHAALGFASGGGGGKDGEIAAGYLNVVRDLVRGYGGMGEEARRAAAGALLNLKTATNGEASGSAVFPVAVKLEADLRGLNASSIATYLRVKFLSFFF